MLNNLLARVLKFLRVDGLHVVTAYVGALVSLLLAGGVSLNSSALLSLLVAAAVAAAKQVNAPAFLVKFLQGLEAKAAKK